MTYKFTLLLIIITGLACISSPEPDTQKISDLSLLIENMDLLSKKDRAKKNKTFYSLDNSTEVTAVSYDYYKELALPKLLKFTDPASQFSLIDFTTYKESGEFRSRVSVYVNAQKEVFAVKNNFGFYEKKCLPNRAIFAKRYYINHNEVFFKIKESLKLGSGQVIDDPSQCELKYAPDLELSDQFKLSDLSFKWLAKLK